MMHDDARQSVTRGRTGEAEFLPETFREAMRAAYGGTALGAQELDGEVVEDRAGRCGRTPCWKPRAAKRRRGLTGSWWRWIRR